MKYFTPYRIAAALLALYCLAHTAGGMLAQSSLGPAADAVFEQMKAVQFDFNGASSTWYGFWFGFGIMVSVFLTFSAVLSWQLDKVTPESWPAVSVIAWGLVVAQAATTVLSWKYFFAGPVIFGVAITLLTAVGAWRKGARARSQKVNASSTVEAALPLTAKP